MPSPFANPATRMLPIAVLALAATLLFLPGLWKLAFIPVYALVLATLEDAGARLAGERQGPVTSALTRHVAVLARHRRRAVAFWYAVCAVRELDTSDADYPR